MPAPADPEAIAPRLITFGEVPEVSAIDLDEFVRDIEARRQEQAPSFGAVIIRAGGKNLAWHAIHMVNKVMSGGLDPVQNIQQECWGDPKPDKPLHAHDFGSNQAAVHVTTEGEADFMMLIGSKGLPSSEEETTRITASLFEVATLDCPEMTMPDRPVRTTSESSHVIIFDPSEPHAFKSKGEGERESLSFYLDHYTRIG